MHDNKKLACHGALAWAIIVLLGLILLVLVFKTGLMVGASKSHFSSCGAKYSHKSIDGLMSKKLGSWQKSAYADYQVVTELTDTGFIAKDNNGKEQVAVITDDTKIIKGGETVEGGIIVGDKVYIDGSTNEAGQVVAGLIKVYDVDALKHKK